MAKPLTEEQEKELRNPYVDFGAKQNLAVQTGNRTIAQQVEDFARASRAIMVSRANAIPEIPGMPVYADHLEIELLRREVDGELLVARMRLDEDQRKAVEQAKQQAEKNAKELERIREIERSSPNPNTTTATIERP